MKKLTALVVCFLFASIQLVNAQQKTISGKVTGADDGLAMPGVSVSVKGTTVGTITDIDGNYTLSVSSDATVLTFSFVGMKTQEHSITNTNVINVVMESEVVGVDEIVVMGFSSRKKSELTGSAVQVNSEILEQQPVASIDQVLQGRVAGLAIAGTSGTPGSEQNIRIRGVSSITAGNEPLYVIDGVPIADNDLKSDDVATSTFSALSSINSANIASITVLKDASATAPYGARGANGVIVITTKQGSKGKTKFNFSTTLGWSNDAVEGPVMLTAAQQEELIYEAFMNDYDYTLAEAQAAADGLLGDWIADGRPEGDWKKHITNKNAFTQDYNLSATGGDEKTTFYAGMGFYSTEATVVGADYERISANLNLTRQLSKRFKFSTINSVSNSFQNGVLEQSAYFSSPRTASFFANPRTSPFNDDGTLNTTDQTFSNPLYIVANDIDQNRLARLLSNNSLTWNIIENLNFVSRFSVDYQSNDVKSYNNRIHGDGDGTNGYAYRLNRNTINTVFQNSLDYKLDVNSHVFDFKVQQEYQQNDFHRLFAEGNEFAADGLSNLDNAGTPLSAESSFTDWKVASYTGMVNYNYLSKYIVNATYRREGNSRFHSEHRWGNFYSVGLAWNMHYENFMDGASGWLTNLKPRASYGVTGNANIPINQYQVMLGFDSNYAGAAAIYPGGYGNELLSWETQSTLDAGLDFGFIENRINGVFSYYYRTSDDLLLNVPLSRTTGFSSQYANIGSMYNKGIELELNFDIVRRNDINFSMGGFLSTVKNEVTELAQDTEGNPRTITDHISKVDEGHLVNEFFMVEFAGVDPATGVNTYYLNETGDETTTVFSEAERRFMGTSGLPTLTAGLNLHFDYKGFFVDLTGYYAGGHQVYEGWHRYIHGSDAYNIMYFNSINTLMDRWQQPGDDTRVEKVTTAIKPWERHSNYLHDGDYFRLKDFTVGYDFSPSVLEGAKIESVRLFVRGTNVYTWVKDKNLVYDPEVGPSGETGMTTPAVKTWTVGLNMNF